MNDKLPSITKPLFIYSHFPSNAEKSHKTEVRLTYKELGGVQNSQEIHIPIRCSICTVRGGSL